MNILLMHLNPMGSTFQLGLAYMSAVLKEDKHNTFFIFLSSLNRKKLFQKLALIKAETIFISVASDSFELCKEIVSFINRELPGIPIFLGGIHPTLRPLECIELEGISGVCRGEGESPAREIIEVLEGKRDYKNVLNVWIKKDGFIYKNNLRPLIHNLDELPMPDYKFFNEYHGDFLILPVMLSRGCPFNCSYCCNHTLRKIYDEKGDYVRRHSVAYSINLLERLIKQFPNVENIEFFDDTFTLDREWLGTFLKEFSLLGKKFICNSRFDILDEQLIKLLAVSGCVKINAAVECGNEDIRKMILRRSMTNNDIIEKTKLLKKYKIALFTHNMVGLPHETEADIVKTIQLNSLIKPNAMQVSVFNPYPDTDLEKVCREKGWIEKNIKPTSFHDFTVLKTPYIKPHIVDYYLIAFESMVNEIGLRLYIKKTLYWFLHFHHNLLYLMLRKFKRILLSIIDQMQRKILCLEK